MSQVMECHVLTSDWPRNAGISFHWSRSKVFFPPLSEQNLWEKEAGQPQLCALSPKCSFNETSRRSHCTEEGQEVGKSICAPSFFKPYSGTDWVCSIGMRLLSWQTMSQYSTNFLLVPIPEYPVLDCAPNKIIKLVVLGGNSVGKTGKSEST